MKVVKIGAIWCGGCLVMNKTWNKLKDNYQFDYEELDYDMDEEEVTKYSPGKVLPVFIFIDKDKEIDRLTGEFSYEELVNKMIEVGIINEKNN
ncbi:MAG: thioredoxin family protein [Bacilli bacterium]|nr:thioredoxin family protein [Bacilli bacterium]